jgi:hypothetical protein
MWANVLNNNSYIFKLYDNVPELNDVRISSILYGDEGDRVTIILDLPLYPDNPPSKWISSKFNTVVVEIDFFNIRDLCIKALNKYCICKISIVQANKYIELSVSGDIEISLKSEVGLIQNIRAYYDSSKVL